MITVTSGTPSSGELKQLISLDMAGNPICSNAGRYAEILFLSIPTLQTVDGRYDMRQAVSCRHLQQMIFAH